MSGESRYACLSCRQRKLKCDRKQPCSNCTARSVECKQQEFQSNRIISGAIRKTYDETPALSSILSRLDRIEAYIQRSQKEDDGHISKPTIKKKDIASVRVAEDVHERLAADIHQHAAGNPLQDEEANVAGDSIAGANELPGAERGHLVGVSTNDHTLVRSVPLMPKPSIHQQERSSDLGRRS